MGRPVVTYTHDSRPNSRFAPTVRRRDWVDSTLIRNHNKADQTYAMQIEPLSTELPRYRIIPLIHYKILFNMF